MRPIINLRHLEENSVILNDELSVRELDIDSRDELVRLKQPLKYNLEAQKMEGGVLVQGTLRLTLDCECARCLKDFTFPVNLEAWACHVPLIGDETAEVINDCVDLTPYIRDDMVLAFPQRPLCEPECKGLVGLAKAKQPSGIPEADAVSNPWAELDKLKL
jgi:uncharacterized metal-binding protein YceD (DUF177 family)